MQCWKRGLIKERREGIKIMTLEYEDDQVKERGSYDVGFSKGDRLGEEEDCILELDPRGVLFGRIIFKGMN